jgi:hypothetical protein
VSPAAVLTHAALSYDEAFAKKMITYCSIAVSDPPQVEKWQFNNAACNKATANDRLIQTYRADDTAFGYVVVNNVEKYVLAAFKVRPRRPDQQ